MKIASVDEDKQMLMKELGRMREQYTTFNTQLDSMKKELKKTLVSMMFSAHYCWLLAKISMIWYFIVQVLNWSWISC